MVVQPDARLAQHAQKGLFGAVFRMLVAADIGEPASGLAQAALGDRFRREERVGPGDERRRQFLVAHDAAREVPPGGKQRVFGADFRRASCGRTSPPAGHWRRRRRG
jgi:hypothetical protein